MRTRSLAALLSVVAPAAARAGILIPDGGGAPLALRREVVSVEVDDQLARATVDQVFENIADKPVDGTYTFPVPDGAGVAGFATWVNGQRVESQMRAKHDAEAAYDAARRSGRAASLGEIGGVNRFTSRVANIPPGQTRRVELRYDEVLRYDSGRVSFLLPLTTPGAPPAELGQLIVQATIRDQREIGAVTSPVGGVDVTRVSPHEVRVRYTLDHATPAADLRVDYQVTSKEVGVRLVTHREAGEDGYFLLTFAPQDETTERDIVNRDVVFVFDISGSMAGKKIEQARRALQLCLGSLHAGDRFDIVAFDDRVDTFRDHVVPATADALQAARTFVGELHDRGGTDIDQALTRALATFDQDRSRPRTILFLTDGQATSGKVATQEILDDVQAGNAGGARLFAFGVGPEVNRDLLERLAVGQRGAVEYIATNEGIDARVGAFYAKMAQPVLSNLSLDFGGRDVQLVYPHTLPDLYKGLDLVVAGRYGGVGEMGEITLRGELNGTRKEYRTRVEFPSVRAENGFVARLWARRRVEALLTEVRLEGETPERREAIVKLAEQWNIATPYTSFVANARAELAELTPDRIQPGDPEIDVHAPASALGVTLVFPFGLVRAAKWEPARGTWTARFLVPRDTPDGVYAVQVVVTMPDRHVERLAMSYVVDTTAPVMTVKVAGRARPGRTVEIVARQVITEAEVKAARGKWRTRADIRPDVKSVAVVGPDGKIVKLVEDRAGRWRGAYRIPATAHGPLALRVRVTDVADNAAEQVAMVQVDDVRMGSR